MPLKTPMEVDNGVLKRERRSSHDCLTKITRHSNHRLGLHMPILALQNFDDRLKEEDSNTLDSCRERTSMTLFQTGESPNSASDHVRVSTNLVRSSGDISTSDSMMEAKTERGILSDERRSRPTNAQENNRIPQTMKSDEHRDRSTHSESIFLISKPSSFSLKQQAQSLGRPRNRILELTAVYDLQRQNFRIIFDLKSLKTLFRILYDLYLISSSGGKQLLRGNFKYLRLFVLLMSWLKVFLLALELYLIVEEKAAQVVLFSKTFNYVASFHLNQLQEVCSLVPVLWELFLTFSLFLTLTLQFYPLAAIMIATTSYHIHKFYPTRKD